MDDDQDFIDLYTKILGRDFQVFSVMSLTECLAFLRKHPFEVDLVLCDIFMPEVNGFEVFDYLRSKDEFSFYPFVFKTSSLNEDVVNRCMLEKQTELISTLMTNHEVIARIKKEISNSNLIKLQIDSGLKLLLNRERGEVVFPPEAYQLRFTSNECEILRMLASSGEPIDREMIIQRLYGENYIITDNNFNTVLSGIRKKIAEFELSIKSIRGKGVTLCAL